MIPPHKVLGIQINASESDIKKAYRQLAIKYHPDKGGDEDKFKEISAAYEIMSNSNKRKEYYNKTEPITYQQKSNIYKDVYDNINNVIFKNRNVFADMLMNNITKRNKGEDVIIDIELSIKEINKICIKNIKYTRNIKCKSCDGKGGKFNICYKCKGRGNRLVNSKTVFGIIFSRNRCIICNGEGYIITESCNDCKGNGTETVYIDKNITIPPITTKKLRIKDSGNFIKNGVSGSLIINIIIDDRYEIDGKDISYELYLSIAEACLGSKIQIQTAQGEVIFNIPPRTQSKKIFRLKGKGLEINNSIGDMYITCNIHTPYNLSIEEEVLMKNILDNDLFKE